MRSINSVVWDAHVAGKIDWMHGLTIDEVEAVLAHPASEGTTRESNHPCRWGYTPSGVYILVVFEWLEVDEVEVITAYPVPE